MIRYLLSALLFIHGLLHLLGFAKAFQLGNITQLTREISKTAGLLWLITALVFTVAVVFFFLDHSSWSLLCLSGIVLSQLLIISCWHDAKFGSIANLLLLAAALPAFGLRQFNSKVKAEQTALLSTVMPVSGKLVSEADLQPLPAMVQQWLRHSGVVGKPMVKSLRLKQTGRMKLKPGSDWMSFSATQYFNTVEPAFIWDTRVEMMPLIFFNGRDKFENGKGEMLIKMMSLVNLVNEKNNPQVNSGSAIRYLAEMCWFPSAALSNYVTWQGVDSLQARATLQVGEELVEGLFTFRPDGELVSFEAERYYGGGPNARKERWLITNTGYKVFDGCRIPYRSSVSWKLKEGEFTWLELEVKEVIYDL